MDIAEPLRASDQDRAGYCRHGKRILKQGVGRNTAKVWRGEFCPAKVCEVNWWRWNGQIGVWVDYREPEDYL